MRKISISIAVTKEVLTAVDKKKDKENRSRNFVVNQILEDALLKKKTILKREAA